MALPPDTRAYNKYSDLTQHEGELNHGARFLALDDGGSLPILRLNRELGITVSAPSVPLLPACARSERQCLGNLTPSIPALAFDLLGALAGAADTHREN